LEAASDSFFDVGLFPVCGISFVVIVVIVAVVVVVVVVVVVAIVADNIVDIVEVVVIDNVRICRFNVMLYSLSVHFATDICS
jgi:hypothetical protein